jgi:hypothetical protein
VEDNRKGRILVLVVKTRSAKFARRTREHSELGRGLWGIDMGKDQRIRGRPYIHRVGAAWADEARLEKELSSYPRVSWFEMA